MKVMNAMSSKNTSDFYFYMVPASWMKKAWPMLTYGSAFNSGLLPVDNWRETIGPICCRDLVIPGTIGSSSTPPVVLNEEEGNAMQRDQTVDETITAGYWKQKEVLSVSPASVRNDGSDLSTLRLLPGILHEVDFYFLGPSAWLLTKQKFGHDAEIKCPVQIKHHNVLAVEIEKDNSVLIPPTGRFRYEQSLNAQSGFVAIRRFPGNVSDDDSTNMIVGDDELSHATNDADNDRMSMEDCNDSQSNVIPLPPSITSANEDYWAMDTTSTCADPIYTSSSRYLRPYGSGLGNLGNTCFMNSTLQCLAHTHPLKRYFLSGEYGDDLNRNNPLGTGGDLATQFAQLMMDIWITTAPPRNFLSEASTGYDSSSSLANNVVYPRNFKYTLGKHAERFVGYDQHDSQELATYLLDALHEDTNLVTKKPYVEKPEQKDTESDQEAADNAWELHLKRENSKVLENFMGQIKSRVQCCKANCNRVSTTFDPFMYLSVPIPGSMERILKVTYVPMNPQQRMQKLEITISKMATMKELVERVSEQLQKFGLLKTIDDLALEDTCAVDIWHQEVYSWYEPKNEVDRIRDNDYTFLYELAPLAMVKAMGQTVLNGIETDDDVGLGTITKHYQLDLATMTKLNSGDDWSAKLSTYLQNPTMLHNAFDPKSGLCSERRLIFLRLMNFIDCCYREVDDDISGQKRSRDNCSELVNTSTNEEDVLDIIERCESSAFLENVRSRHDLAILEFIASKMRKEIVSLENQQTTMYPDGVIIQIHIRKATLLSGNHRTSDTVPLIMRVSGSMTVYELREELARRLKRCLNTGRGNVSGESTSEQDEAEMSKHAGNGSFASPELLIIRQIPLSYQRKSLSNYRSTATLAASRQLGSLELVSNKNRLLRPRSLASKSNEDERSILANLVGHHGTVFMEWPETLYNNAFDPKEYEHFDCPSDLYSDECVARKSSNATTVLDCIEKYCQMEQLEDTEMWYCNKCKDHVRAWKQTHLYRCPPILIVHLKRFQYSSSTHRRDKIGLFIDFPLEGLDLTSVALHWTGAEKPLYDCYAVSNHYGGLGGGHYTAYALNDDKVWCHYDDSRVTANVEPEKVVSEAAYVLYYRRRDVLVGQDIPLPMQTSIVPSVAVIVQENADKEDDPTTNTRCNASMIATDMEIVSRSTSPMGSVGGDSSAYQYNVEQEDLPLQ
jgi:ubiquitin carboxyl-terminal hydrolase 4/11/15